MTMLKDKDYKKFKELSDKYGHKYETELEMKQSADSLVRFVEVLVKIDQEEKARERRLLDEPKGFSMQSHGRTCHGCSDYIMDGEMWYDKWGMKCMKCQEALSKKAVPGYVFKDYKNDKSVNLSTLSHKSGLYPQTIKKLVRQDKIKARIYKGSHGELWMFLRKENPELWRVVEEEKVALERNKH